MPRLSTQVPLVSPFPWHVIPPINRDLGRTSGALSRWFRGRVSWDALAAACGDLVIGRVSFRAAPLGSETRLSTQSWFGPIFFASPEAGWRFEVFAEPALVQIVVRRALGRSSNGVALAGPADPSLVGAFEAVVVEGFRRAGLTTTLLSVPPLEATDDSAPDTHTLGATSEPASLDLLVTVSVDERPYGLRVRASRLSSPATDSGDGRTDAQRLRELGSLPLAIPLVVAQSQVSRELLASLALGDAWMPGEGWLLDPRLGGRAWLACPFSERAVAVWLTSEGRLTLEAEEQRLPWDVEMTDTSKAAATEEPQPKAGLPENVSQVLDVPVVVRLELSAITLSARQWADLAPGDVLETGQRLLAPAVLRVGGVAVATGELVNVEGELGVRILTLNTHE